MPWPGAIFLGLLTGVIGAFYAGFMADLAVPWLRVSRMEGNASVFMLFMAVLGFVLSTALGITICRMVGGEGNAGVARGFGASVLVVVGLISAAGALAWAQRERAPVLVGAGGVARPLDLAVEVRMPPGWPRPVPHHEGASQVDLQGGRVFAGGPLRLAEAREEDGRWIVPATVAVASTASDRVLSVRQPQQPTQHARPSLAATPVALDEQWSAWIEPMDGAAPADRRLGIRHRLVARAPDAAAEARRAAFEALPPDAPAEALRPFLSALWRDPVREDAIRRLLMRDDANALLVAWMGDPDPAVARDAMFIVRTLSPGTPDFAGPVRARAAEVVRIAEAIEPGAPDARRRLYDSVQVLATGVLATGTAMHGQRIDIRPELRAMADAVRPREGEGPPVLSEALAAMIALLDSLARSRAELERNMGTSR
jgi:hypothetical protein